MSGEFMQSQTAQQASGPDPGLSGVMIGRVIGNCDTKRLGRVHVRLAARGGMELWARITVMDTGAYFIPQNGDEVLVAFHQGDGNEAYVIGRLCNENNRPPRSNEGDPNTQRVIRTPAGHEIAFDETEQSVVITTGNGQHIEMKPEGIKIKVDKQSTGTISMDNAGNIKIESSSSITMKSPHINLDAENLDLGGKSSARIDGGSYCSINAGMIYIG
jgi:uncharacterized protein involved in type VI secretion and phage assembly